MIEDPLLGINAMSNDLENIIHETRNKPIVRRLTVTRMITALNVILDDVYE